MLYKHAFESNSFCSTHNEVFEAMDEPQETMVTRFMDTSLKYLHGASEHRLYIMVARCLEVCVCISVYITYMKIGLVYSAYIQRKLPLVLRSYICGIHDVTMIYIQWNLSKMVTV